MENSALQSVVLSASPGNLVEMSFSPNPGLLTLWGTGNVLTNSSGSFCYTLNLENRDPKTMSTPRAHEDGEATTVAKPGSEPGYS